MHDLQARTKSFIVGTNAAHLAALVEGGSGGAHVQGLGLVAPEVHVTVLRVLDELSCTRLVLS